MALTYGALGLLLGVLVEGDLAFHRRYHPHRAAARYLRRRPVRGTDRVVR
jgi:hypothetical protein